MASRLEMCDGQCPRCPLHPKEALEAQAGWRSQVPSYNRALLEFAKRIGALAVDIEGEFEGRSDAFADECHFTLEGHQRMARILLREISTNHLLDQDE